MDTLSALRMVTMYALSIFALLLALRMVAV